MILFVGILVFASAAYLNVTRSAAIDGAESAATSLLSSWNPNVSCVPALVTVQTILGSAYPAQSLSGSQYQVSSTAGGIPDKRALSPPCTIQNVHNNMVSTFVEVDSVYLYDYLFASGDCSKGYKQVNGGGPYPNSQTFCDNTGDIRAMGTTDGYIHIEFDQDWLAKGYCGSSVSYCNNVTIAQKVSSGTISLNLQGFVYWDDTHWELHPLAAWKLSAPPTPPSAPQNLAATGGNAQVTLTWKAPASDGGSPVTNYKIYRGVAPGSETLLTTVGNVLTYTDSAATNGVTYYYQVSAVNSPGEGAKSNEASATPSAPPPPPTPPSAPMNLVATAGNAQVGLTWQAPGSNGGSAITNYKIYRGTTSGGETLKTTIGNVLTYSDTTVTNGLTYYYQVSAVNAAGEGPRSNEASAVPSAPPPPPSPPSAPTNLVATAGNAQVGLTWQAPGSNGGSAITNYKIYRGTSSNGETLIATIGNQLSYSDGGLTNGVTYYYQVSAVNNVGEGLRSNEASATPTAPATPPGAPQGLSASPGDATVTLTWSAPSSNGGSPITNYRIYRATTSGGETLKATIGNQLSYSDGGLTNGVTYYYQVSAVNNVGEGPRSNEASATPTAPAGPPTAPQGLGASPGDATVTLTWSAPSSNGGSPITNYRIYRGTSSNGETLKTTIGNVLTYTDTTVTNGVTYYYQVSAVNSAGEGPRSNEASATPSAPPPPPSPPSAPTNLVATAGNAQVGLTWQAPGSNGGSQITNYRIYRGTSSNGETLLATIGNVLTYTDTAVSNGVTYYYQVSAVNNVGEGPRSNEASATPSAPPPPPTPPSAPTNLVATVGNAQVTLTWQAPASNGGSPITNYRIYRATTSGGETLKATIGNQLSYSDGGLTNGVTYYYQVSAVNAAGEGPRSNEASATPTAPATPPGAPQGLVATAGDATVTLTWSAPSSNGGSPITNYRIYRGTSSNGETLLATIGNVLTYTDTAVTNGVTYYYQVSAVNNVGEGLRSNEASATPTVPVTPPGAPQGLGATAGDATVTLTWSAPSSNGGSPITNYKIYRGTSSNGETLKATIGNVLTYTDTTVTNGVTYYYQVSAVNAAGEGPRSNEASATPSPPPPPPDFSISATPASLSIPIGSSGTSTITLTSLNGFAGTIGLSTSISCSGLCLVYPTASLNPTSVTLTSGGTGISTLTVATSVATTPGTYTITITATSGSNTHTVTVTVTVHL